VRSQWIGVMVIIPRSPLEGGGVRVVLLLRGKLGLAGKPVVNVFARIDPLVEALHQARPALSRDHDATDL
jgi:hypothetical protein